MCGSGVNWGRWGGWTLTPSQILVNFFDDSTRDFLVIVFAQLAQRMRRRDNNQCRKVAAKRALSQQIGGFGGKAILLNLMKIGFFHCAAAASRTGEAATRRIARLLAVGRIVLLVMCLDAKVDMG